MYPIFMDSSWESALNNPTKGQQNLQQKTLGNPSPAPGPHATTGYLATTSWHGATGVNETTCQPGIQAATRINC